jgi:hypothetical protein
MMGLDKSILALPDHAESGAGPDSASPIAHEVQCVRDRGQALRGLRIDKR